MFAKLKEYWVLTLIGSLFVFGLIGYFISALNIRTGAIFENNINEGVVKVASTTAKQQTANTATSYYLTTFKSQLGEKKIEDKQMVYVIGQSFQDLEKEGKVINPNNKLMEALENDKTIKLILFPTKSIVIKEKKEAKVILLKERSLKIDHEIYNNQNFTGLDNKLKGYDVSATGVGPFTKEQAEEVMNKYLPSREMYQIEGTDKYILINKRISEEQNEGWGWFSNTKHLVSLKDEDGNMPKPFREDGIACEQPDEYQEKVGDKCYDALMLHDNGATIIATKYAVSGKKYKLRNDPYIIKPTDERKYRVVETREQVLHSLGNDELMVTTRINFMKGWLSYRSSAKQDLRIWDTSNVTSMERLFYGNNSNSGNYTGIENFDLSKVKNMSEMFADNNAFNYDISSWDVSNVENFSGMFKGAVNFNQNLNNWNTKNAKDLSNMFKYTSSYNQPMDKWDVRKVISFFRMFEGSAFNQNIETWDVSNATSLAGLFYGATKFNQPLDRWNTSNVTSMGQMFDGASSFNQPLNNWDVSKVTNFEEMFMGATKFNQPLDRWNTRSAVSLIRMFSYARSFNQDLSMWKFSNLSGNDRYVFGFKNYTDSWKLPKPIFVNTTE